MPQPIRIIIADDHTLFIEGLCLLLKDEEVVEIVDIAHDGKELLGLIRKTSPDIILLDINMPEMNGLDAVRRIKQEHPRLKVIMLSSYNEEHLIEKAKVHGANGYLLKNVNKEELIQTICLVNQGKSCFPYRLPATHSDLDKEDSFLKQFNLTKREQELLQLIKTGFTNQQIADQLYLSIYTVETHRKNIMQKLGLKTATELVRFIIQHNI